MLISRALDSKLISLGIEIEQIRICYFIFFLEQYIARYKRGEEKGFEIIYEGGTMV